MKPRSYLFSDTEHVTTPGISSPSKCSRSVRAHKQGHAADVNSDMTRHDTTTEHPHRYHIHNAQTQTTQSDMNFEKCGCDFKIVLTDKQNSYSFIFSASCKDGRSSASPALSAPALSTASSLSFRTNSSAAAFFARGVSGENFRNSSL